LDYILKPGHCDGEIPNCEACGGAVRPDVVLYEEPLDQRVMDAAVYAIFAADCLIVGGTSLAVYPAAGLLHYIRGSHLVLINKSVTPYDDQAGLVIHEPIGVVFSAVMEEMGI
jgi:NAD-dependent deacetylase